MEARAHSGEGAVGSGGAALMETRLEQAARPVFTGQWGQPQPGAVPKGSGRGRCWPNAACRTARDSSTLDAPRFLAESFGRLAGRGEFLHVGTANVRGFVGSAAVPSSVEMFGSIWIQPANARSSPHL